MREIKFRAWSNKYQHMFRVSEISQDRSGYTHGIVDAEFKNEFEPEFDSPFAWIGRVDFKKSSDGRVAALGQNPDDEPFYLMQYTGLKDKNGREIYEGDILKRTVTIIVYGSGKPPEDVVEYMKVEYREDYAGFYISERPLHAYVDNTLDIDTGCRCTKPEVIGDVYRNPKLLEASHASE
ncbi:hypothetical protein BG30_00230 [Bacillus subtilis subsp. subtilis]|nr:hypothetical protein BG30_00230 [Bacillus subtilis subsp. subtilis]